MDKLKTILYFGTYDPNYSRNRVLIKGLRQNGIQVLECNDRSKSFFKYINLFFKYLKFINKFDAMIVGFPGQEVMLLARLLTRKRIIFDAFTSHFGGYVLDRGKHKPNSLMAKWYKWIDRKSVLLSDVALLDTDAHIDFFVREFGLPKKKFIRVFVGTDSDVFYPRNIQKNTDAFLVHFHGNYIPLQGVEYIVRAAKLLENENIVFNLIGKGQTYNKVLDIAKKLNVENINFIDRVSYEKLSDFINEADVCLGIFGKTVKTNLVIPNKVFEAVACNKPVITAQTSAAKELFQDRQNVLFCNQADENDLAKKIMELKNDHELRTRIAAGGFNVFSECLTEKYIVSELLLKIWK